MAGGYKNRGYTIIEVMIFLAISGLMFVISANFISGKQANAEFNQGINNIAAQINQSINDVSNGYYQSADDVVCSVNGSGNPQLSSGSATKGTNKGCVYMGKLYQFKVGGDSQAYQINDIVGLKIPTGGNITDNPTSFATAKPAISTSFLKESKKLQWGLTIEKMKTTSSSDIGSFVIVKNFAAGSDGSGSQSIIAIPIQMSLGSAVTTITPAMAAALDTSSGSDESISMCFKGGNEKYGVITVGGSGQKSTATIKQISNDKSQLPECN